MHHRVLERRRNLLAFIRVEAEAENQMTLIEMASKTGYGANLAMLRRDIKALVKADKLEPNGTPKEA